MYKNLIIFFLALSLQNDPASAMLESGKRGVEDTDESARTSRPRVSYGSSHSSAEEESAGSGGSSPETVQCHFSLPVTDEMQQPPQLTHSWQFILQIPMDPLEALFQAPTHRSADLLKTRLKGITLEASIDLLKTTKNKIELTTDIPKIRALQVPLQDVLKTLVENLDAAALLARLPFISQEVLDVRPERLASTLLGHVFFPKEFSDGYTPFSMLASNWPIHRKLAIAARAGYPTAQQFLARLLKERFPDAAQRLIAQAQEIDQAIIGDLGVPAYFKGLAWGHLWVLSNDDQEENRAESLRQAQTHFEQSLADFPGPAHYAFAKIAGLLEKEKDSLSHYQQAADVGYARAYFRRARLSTDIVEAFQNYKRAGELGIGEAYFEIARMLDHGRALHLTEADPHTYEGWLTRAAENGSMVAWSALARLARQREDSDQEFQVWQRVAALGYATGFLGQGQILENKAQVKEALAVYRESNAGSYGLYDYVRKWGHDPQLLEEAEQKDRAHYASLVRFLNLPQ